MIIWILINLYHRNLKDLKEFIDFLKTHLKLQKLLKKIIRNDKVWIKKKVKSM